MTPGFCSWSPTRLCAGRTCRQW